MTTIALILLGLGVLLLESGITGQDIGTTAKQILAGQAPSRPTTAPPNVVPGVVPQSTTTPPGGIPL